MVPPPSTPRISILIPTRNRAALLEQAVRSAMAQTCTDIEILVSDNRSTDETVQVLGRLANEDPRIRWWTNHSDLGVQGNYRCLLREARGEFVKFLNDDDLLDRTCVERLAAPFATHPDLALTSSRRSYIDQDGARVEDPTGDPERLRPRSGWIEGRALVQHCLRTMVNWIGEPTAVMFRRDLVSATTAFNYGGREFTALADMALWFGLLSRGDAHLIADRLCVIRTHHEQDTWRTAIQVGFRVDFVELLARARRHGVRLGAADTSAALETLVPMLCAMHDALRTGPEAAALTATIARVPEIVAEAVGAERPGPAADAVTLVVPVGIGVRAAVTTLSAIADHTPQDQFEIVVVDRSAAADVGALLDGLDGDVQVVRVPSDASARSAWAAGLAKASCETVVLLDASTVVGRGWLEPLRGPLDGLEEIAGVAAAAEHLDIADLTDLSLTTVPLLALAGRRAPLLDACRFAADVTAGDSLRAIGLELRSAGRVVVERASRTSSLAVLSHDTLESARAA